MKPKTVPALAALLTILVAALAAGCGSSSDSKKPAGAAGNPTDRAFVADMVPHHRSAVEMAAIAKSEATSPFVKTLAADISSTQKAEIAQMQRVDGKLADAGIKKGELGMSHDMEGMHMDAQELRGAKPFDAKFISMMLPHHEAAIPMARAELAKGENAELKKLAKEIIATQEREIKQMRAHEKGSSGSPDTDGTHSSHSG